MRNYDFFKMPMFSYRQQNDDRRFYACCPASIMPIYRYPRVRFLNCVNVESGYAVALCRNLGHNSKIITLSEPKTVQFFFACECFRKGIYLFHACGLLPIKSYDFSTLAGIFLINRIQPGWNSFPPLFHRLTFTAIVGSCRKVHHPFSIFFLGDEFFTQLFSAKLPLRKKFIEQMIVKLNSRLRISKFIGNRDDREIVNVLFFSIPAPDQKADV